MVKGKKSAVSSHSESEYNSKSEDSLSEQNTSSDSAESVEDSSEDEAKNQKSTDHKSRPNTPNGAKIDSQPISKKVKTHHNAKQVPQANIEDDDDRYKILNRRLPVS